LFSALSRIQARVKGMILRKKLGSFTKAKAYGRNNYGRYQYATYSRIVSIN